MAAQLTKSEILILAAACRQWPPGRADYWYLGENPWKVVWLDKLKDVFRERGAKDG